MSKLSFLWMIFTCVTLLSACKKDDEKLSLKNVIEGSWEVSSIQIGGAPLPMTQPVEIEFTGDQEFKVGELTGDYEASDDELRLIFTGQDIKLKMQIDNKDQIRIVEEFRMNLLSILSLFPEFSNFASMPSSLVPEGTVVHIIFQRQ
ncbi:MAG: hypothetical protein LBR08_12030 [Bacteroidales bacterium]|jgi:hypothetical protein|nr:hypothetical protein [Bacteroidales bacterium]